MKVTKRDGSHEDVSFDKVLNRVKILSNDLHINVYEIAQKVCNRIYDGVKTSELDELTAQICSSLMADDNEYEKLARRITISNHHKKTSPSFSETIESLYNNEFKIISDEVYEVVQLHKDKLNSYIDYNRDYNFDYFGFKTIERAYLMKKNGKVVERPQHMFMRVSIGIHGKDIKDVLETYDGMSNKLFLHATPTLFNFGTPRQQGSSCFLLHMNDDSISGIYESLAECAAISKYAGGIGIHIHNVRGKNSVIRGTNGTSDGIVPMLRVFNSTARYVNQCFTPETMIITENDIKPISEVNENDYVLTKDGSFKKVNEVICNKVDKDILEIKTTHSFEPIRVTKEHEIYVIKNQTKGLNYNVIKNRLSKGLVEAKYIPAIEIENDDLIGYPKIQYDRQKDDRHSSDYYRFIGLMLGDGHICKNRNEAGITLNKTSKLDAYEFIIEYLQKNNINYWENAQTGCVSVRFTNKIVSRDKIYNNESEKYVHQLFMDLNYENTLSLVRGLIESDGSIGKEIYYTTSSYALAHGLKYLLYKLDILSSGYIKNNIGETHYIRENESITTKKLCYQIRIPKVEIFKTIFPNIECSHYTKYFEHDDILWTRIKMINTMYYTGNVYDLNIIDNHNYVLSSFGLVHNSGRRNGSIAIYLEPWHSDIESFLDMRKNHGNEEERARDLFYALWIPDLFMKRVKSNGMWSLMCPDECKNLSNVYGDEFELLYEEYEKDGKYRKQMKAQDLWLKIMESQIETGTPYMLYKDAINRKSNQKNLGIIKSSNLCTEIVEYTSPDEIAVCNLASLCLPSYINEDGTYNFEKLGESVKIVTKNLNKIIDKNFYPVDKARVSNLKHRPIGIGVQGLHDTFMIMKYPYESPEAKELNRKIFETIYYYSMKMSMEISKKRQDSIESGDITYNVNLNEYENDLIKFKGAYSTFDGSPLSHGEFQFDMWNVKAEMYDWDSLRKEVMTYGVRNSLLLAPMPTASTSQIMGFTESFEVITSNIYKRKTLAGEFIIINKYLIKDLKELGIWNTDIKEKILIREGSVQNIHEIPEKIQNLYKTAWEIKQKSFIDQAADRGAFICQSQSMNLFVDTPTLNKLNTIHFYTWNSGLKTGMYYLRTKPKANTQQFTIDPTKAKSNIVVDEEQHCESCSA